MSCGVDHRANRLRSRVAGLMASSYDCGRNRAMRIDFHLGDERLALPEVARDCARESEGRQ